MQRRGRAFLIVPLSLLAASLAADAQPSTNLSPEIFGKQLELPKERRTVIDSRRAQ